MSSISACILLSLAALILLGQPGRGASFLGVGRGRARPAGGRFGMNRVAAAGNGAAMKPFFQGRQHMSKRSGAAPGPASSSSAEEGGEGDGGFLVIAEAPPKLLEARQHGKTVLECAASGNPAPQITWLKDGQPLIKEYTRSNLLDGDYGDFALESLSETKSKISLDCVSEEDAGLYECVAHTSAGRKTSVGTEVHVVSFEPNGCTPRHLLDFTSAPPVIYQWMGTYLQLIGTDAHLVCRAEGGRHRTQWRGPMNEVLGQGEKYKILPNGDLIVRDLTFDDMGMYKCEVSNENGADMKETFVYPHAA